MLLIHDVEDADIDFLADMLYEALYLPPGQTPFPREILNQPDVARYLRDYGREGDTGLVAMVDGLPVGAAWARLWKEGDHGYAFVDEETPEISVALRPEYRGRDIGTMLLEELIHKLDESYEASSLSVHPRSPAVRLYQRLGFSHVDWVGESMLMVRFRSEITAIAL